MYTKGFFIEKPVGNNALSYDLRKLKKLYVPALKKIDDLSEISLGDEIAFSDFDFDGNLIEQVGLKNFYEISWKNKAIYLFDNHNHAYYFWYLARKNNIIGNNNLLIHIDEHSDLRDPGVYQTKEETSDLQKVFDFTNFTLNVGNYIIPAQKEGIIKDFIQIRNEFNLNEYLQKPPLREDIICNLDLDFFEPNLDFIDYDLKKKVVLDACEKAKVITVCTSPFFIDQNLALDVFFDIFKN
ncbi:MAG: UPF0489 family protein [Candidatus Gracilibacteria bacterium]|nr:UPF0489 family protein [Candidatus Gracilibacteria bacterium]